MKWKLKGGHKQETRSGKNKIPLSSAKTINGVNLSVDEKGIYTLSGTATGDCFFSIPLKSVLTADVSRTMSLQILNGTASTTGAFYLAFRIRNSSGVYGEAELKYKSGTSKYTTKTITTECATAEITVVSGTTLNNIKLAIQLEDGTKATSIEQYGMMPSTDYPSEIETVGSNVQLFDKDNVNKLNAVPDVSSIVANFSGKSFYIKVKSNTTYTVSRKIIGSRFVVGTTANLPAAGETIIDRKVNNEGSSITLTTSKNVNYLVVYYLYNSSENEEEILDNIKIEKGSTATPWSAYGTGCTEIKVQNRNFLYYTAQNQTINDVEFLINKDKSIKVKGTATATADFYLIGNANTYEDIGATGNFKISGCKSNSSSKYMLYVVQKDINNKLSYYQNVQESINITIKKGDTFRVFIRVLSQITVNDTIFPALQSSDDNNSIYVESKKQTIVMPVQQEMLQGDYIEDVEHHEWGKIIITGEENWVAEAVGRFSIGKEIYISRPKTPLTNDDYVGNLCNCYAEKTPTLTWNKKQGFCVTRSGDYMAIYDNTYSPNSDVNGFKAWLKSKYDANDPVMIYYKLANAIDLELTEAQKAVREQKLHTYKNITNINLSDELASIDVTYKKDLDTILNNLQAQIIANASEEVTE